MDSLINKITLYDLTAMTIPGMIILLIFITFVPSEAIKVYTLIDNALVVAIIFFLLSYCVGWTLSQASKYIFYKIEKCSLQLSLIPGCVLLAALILFIVLNFDCRKIILSFLGVILYFILILVKGKTKKNKQRDKFLIDQGYEALKKYFGDKYLKDNNDEEKQKKIRDLARSYNGLIQTYQRYGRIHNYSSSKSFSKNLAGVSFFLSLTFLYNFLLPNGIKFDVIYYFAYLISILAMIILQLRYHEFKEIVDILSITYFIDYVENNKRGGIQYEKK